MSQWQSWRHRHMNVPLPPLLWPPCIYPKCSITNPPKIALHPSHTISLSAPPQKWHCHCERCTHTHINTARTRAAVCILHPTPPPPQIRRYIVMEKSDVDKLTWQCMECECVCALGRLTFEDVDTCLLSVHPLCPDHWADLMRHQQKKSSVSQP